MLWASVFVSRERPYIKTESPGSKAPKKQQETVKGATGLPALYFLIFPNFKQCLGGGGPIHNTCVATAKVCILEIHTQSTHCTAQLPGIEQTKTDPSGKPGTTPTQVQAYTTGTEGRIPQNLFSLRRSCVTKSFTHTEVINKTNRRNLS